VLYKQTITPSILDLIGQTPLIPLLKFQTDVACTIFAKCEMFNPSLSIKDRIVLSMLRAYEKKGLLKPAATIYEASSGNTGSSLAMIGAILGYKVIITVPDKTSLEKINTMKLFGAKVIVCKKVSESSPEHYSNMAKILSMQDPGSLYFNQYENPSNVDAHYQSTAQEIWNQTQGKIDCLVITASSGGTITGVGRFMKEKNPNIKIILADPIGSIFYDSFYGNELKTAPYKTEGAGKDKICDIHDFTIIDRVIQFSDNEAMLAVKKLACAEGILAGESSGGALAVAEKITKMSDKSITPNGKIVVILPDSGMKYLSKIKLDN